MSKQYLMGILLGVCLMNVALAADSTPFAHTCKNVDIPASTPSEDFILHDNQTVTHLKTGLMWKRCPEGHDFNSANSNNFCSGGVSYPDLFTYNLQGAFTQVKAVNELINSDGSIGFAGYTNWRMPNVKEMFSIIENCGSQEDGAQLYNTEVFIGTGHYAGSFWTNTPSMYESGKNWVFRQNEVEQASRGQFRSLLLVRDLGN